MSLSIRNALRLATAIALLGVLDGCVVPDGSRYDSGVSVSYGVGFYEPFGYEYGEWGPRYYGGPPRRGVWHPPVNRPHSPAYRPPRPGRPMPSIPNRPRPGRR